MAGPDILSPEFAENPYPFYREMREKHPLYYHEATESWIVSRHDDVDLALRSPEFTTRNYEWQLEPVHGRTILQMEGRQHSVHRNLVTPAFRGRQLFERFAPVIERNAAELIDSFRSDGHADLVNQFSTRLPINVIVDMLGLPKSDHALFHRWYSSIMAFLANLSRDPQVHAEGLRTRDELRAYLLPVIQRRRQQPGDDLLSHLCSSEIDGERMSDEEIKAFVSLLLVAGGETTDKAMASFWRNLIQRPELLAQVRRDRRLVDRVGAETLRFTPPVHMLMRQPSRDVEVSGGEIPAGATVTCLIGAANRDEARFAEPDRFDAFRPDLDPERAFGSSANHLSFGGGRHFCVGASLAQLEMRIGANLLLDALDEIRFTAGKPPPEVGIFTRAPLELPVSFHPAEEEAR